MGEFDIIEKYFKHDAKHADVELGVGDDCAIVNISAGEQLIMSTDSLVESVHFPPQSNACDLGYRSCATALSDIAAMGGSARWASLALTLPNFEASWLSDFARGFQRACALDNTVLIGGDLTSGPLSVTWHITGTVPRDTAMRRSGNAPGELIFVTGELGGASAAVDWLGSDQMPEDLWQAYWLPQPRLAFGRAIRPLASSCIDISDGLLGDLQHLLTASDTAAMLDTDRVPIAKALAHISPEDSLALALNGGDDYELCFTAPKDNGEAINELASRYGLAVSQIGEIVSGENGAIITSKAGEVLVPASFEHFA